MTLNPLKWVEWLINEHGSSTVLRERLGQAKDQNDILARKILELTAKIVELESKITKLETEKKTLTKENEKLKIQIENHKKFSQFRPQMF